MVTSEELPIEEQIDILQNLSMLPEYVILLNVSTRFAKLAEKCNILYLKNLFTSKMQDVDLYKRRIEQKYDPDTSQTYIRQHYSKFNTHEEVFPVYKNQHMFKYGKNSQSQSDVADISDFSDSMASPRSGGPGGIKNVRRNFEIDEIEDPLDGSRDFIPLGPDILFRLITRTEDNPVLVNDDLEQFRYNLPALQAYVENFDKRKVLEIDAYWAPSVIFKVL